MRAQQMVQDHAPRIVDLATSHVQIKLIHEVSRLQSRLQCQCLTCDSIATDHAARCKHEAQEEQEAGDHTL